MLERMKDESAQGSPNPNSATPAQDGFHMPAEWDPHEGTWLQWPHEDTDPGNQLVHEPVWLAMTAALHDHESVHIVVQDERRRDHLDRQLNFYGLNTRHVELHILSTDDCWVRDNGPIFLIDDEGRSALTDWNFNGWGGRFPCDRDRVVPSRVARILSMPLYTAPVVLEGGGIEVNGTGTLLATRSAIVNPNRNPDVDQMAIESALRDYLGVRHVIWLSGAPRDYCDSIGDTTDFHVDGAARFVDESTVIYTWWEGGHDPYLERHVAELREAQTAGGKPLTLVPLPIPRDEMYVINKRESRPLFVRSICTGVYTNYYVANGVVLVPVFGDYNDANAKSIIAEHYPNREIIGIPARALTENGGTMHCITQQQPAVFGSA